MWNANDMAIYERAARRSVINPRGESACALPTRGHVRRSHGKPIPLHQFHNDRLGLFLTLMTRFSMSSTKMPFNDQMTLAIGC
jgi:hypothetical protein